MKIGCTLLCCVIVAGCKSDDDNPPRQVIINSLEVSPVSEGPGIYSGLVTWSVENQTPETQSIHLTAIVYASDGTVIDTVMESSGPIPPGGIWASSASTHESTDPPSHVDLDKLLWSPN